MSKVLPVGHRILVLPDEVETKSSSGIILAIDEEKERAASQFGTVLAIGEGCWVYHTKEGTVKDTPWCSVGDKVLFAKYAGRMLDDTETGHKLIILNDDDVMAVIKESNDGDHK